MLKFQFLIDDKSQILISADRLHTALYRLGRILENSTYRKEGLSIHITLLGAVKV
jgi:hypothetical protein